MVINLKSLYQNLHTQTYPHIAYIFSKGINMLVATPGRLLDHL